MTEKEAREIENKGVSDLSGSGILKYMQQYFVAQGYLEAIEKAERIFKHHMEAIKLQRCACEGWMCAHVAELALANWEKEK